MPLFRKWTFRTDAPPTGGVFAAATYLGLAGGWSVRRQFFHWNREIEAQLGRTDGVLAFAVQRAMVRPEFWTLSLWVDRAHIGAFVQATPHRAAAAWLKDGHLRSTKFAHWEVPSGMPSWEDVYQRLGVPVPGARVIQPPTPMPPGWRST